MTAAGMWARAELRARWRAWVLLGLLAGATVGVAAEVFSPRRLGNVSASLFPVAPASIPILTGPLVAGRLPDPARADEIVVDENTRDQFDLPIGSTVVLGQTLDGLGSVPPEFIPPGGIAAFRQPLRVVGVAKSVSSDLSWTPSSGFYAKYGSHMPQIVNVFVDLRGGPAAIPEFTDGVSRILGHPVNVEDTRDLYGIRKATNVTDLERDGLLLFALAALLGGGVLVGQALVRTVSASAADLPTWRAIGADRRLALVALVIPAVLTAIVALATTCVIAVALSSRFPLGTARDYDLDLGTHFDWFVLGLAVLAVFFGVVAVAAAAAWWRVNQRVRADGRPSLLDRVVAPMSRAPALMIGARLAGEPGHGRRAVPVRSALIGAIAGVLGVVGCMTFRAGIQDAITEPSRSGVVWDFGLAAGGGSVPDPTIRAVARDASVADALRATWHRAVPIDGRPVPMFATRAVTGHVRFVLLRGRRPVRAGEVALAPTTMRELHVAIGDRVKVGSDPGIEARVVGEALLPATSHTDYDQSGWMTAAGMTRAVPDDDAAEDYLLMRWRAGTDAAAAQRRLVRIGGPDLFPIPATLPTAVADLARVQDLPLALAGFFALLACATVAHALVTTVRRRRHDLAVLRSIGFTRRQTRGAIAWQATLLAVVGIVVGVPLGIAVGRLTWRWLADDFPIAYVPPLAALAVLLVASIALVLANALAAGPAHVASRIRPADALRVE